MKNKYSIKTIILSILGIFFFQFSFSQQNYLPGYIVQLNGDTLHGVIDYRNWERNPGKTIFKKTAGEKESVYLPLDIKTFGVKDEVYQSAIVQREISANNLDNINFDSELYFLTDTVFLQTIVAGAKSLYFYSDNSGKEQFYIKLNSKYELLMHKKYKDIQDGPYGKQQVVTENNKYLGQLAFYLQACPSIQTNLRGIRYDKKSLENIFLSYYKCTQEKITFHKKTEKLSLQIGALAGITITTLHLRSDMYDYLATTNFQQSVNFMPGIFFDIILPRNNGKWSICNEITLTTYKMSGRFDIYHNENYYTNNYLTIGYSYLNMKNMLRFKYPVGKIFIYLDGGVSNGYAVHETNYRRKETQFYTPGTMDIVESKAILNTAKSEIGYLFGAGVRFKNYSFEIREERGSGMSNSQEVGSFTNRLYFLLGYRF